MSDYFMYSNCFVDQGQGLSPLKKMYHGGTQGSGGTHKFLYPLYVNACIVMAFPPVGVTKHFLTH